MIVKQYNEVIGGTKTQTRRMKDRYQVGRVYSVVPKMYQPSVYYWWEDSYFFVWHEGTNNETRKPMPSDGDFWQQLKVRITGKRQERLQEISEEDAIAEGIKADYLGGYFCDIPGHHITANSARGCYIGLWDAINTKPDKRWEANPMVWVYTFEVVT